MTVIHLSHCSLMASIALLLIYHDDGFVINAIIRSRAVESSYSYSSYNNNYNDQDIKLKCCRRSSRRSYGGDGGVGGGGGMTMNVAPFKRPRAQNVPGNLYVDESCIDCDACRWICPSVFNRYTISIVIPLFLYIYIYILYVDLFIDLSLCLFSTTGNHYWLVCVN